MHNRVDDNRRAINAVPSGASLWFLLIAGPSHRPRTIEDRAQLLGAFAMRAVIEHSRRVSSAPHSEFQHDRFRYV
jgi:hypothetical protein